MIILSVLLMVFLPLKALSGSGQAVDHSVYADLLKKYVKDGVVNYRGFKEEESRLDGYLKVLEKTDSKNLNRNEQFAFYINAYNAWTIKLILSKYPDIKSIKNLGTLFQSPWEKRICRIDGKGLSLDEIEHKILRPVFKDPRVHFALNCASKGCPSLISEPYTGSHLGRQLDTSAQRFIHDPQKNYLQNETLFVSSIFKWYAQDFGNDIPGFFSRYASEGLGAKLAANSGKIKIVYLDYDWSLNGN